MRAATFDEMKSNASKLAPETTVGLWKDDAKFFASGTSGQWEGALSAESLKRYEQARREKLSPSLTDWLERGSLACGTPETLPD